MLHTDIPTTATIRQLAAVSEPFTVSIYLPTTPISTDTESARIDLKNLLSEAVAQLEAAHADTAFIAALDESVTDLGDDRLFWDYQSHSLALFFTSAGLWTYRLPNRLPRAVEVSDRLFIKPILRALTFSQEALVLAISNNAVRLVEMTIDERAAQITVPDLPEDASEYFERRASRLAEGATDKVVTAAFARDVDKAIRPILNGLDTPLIIAAAEPIASIYRNVSSYPHIAGDVVAGNPDDLSEHALAEAARPILDALNAAELDALKIRVADAIGQGRGATDLSDLARAATYGAIDTLIVDIDHAASGFIDETSGVITASDNDDARNYGIVDEIARRVLNSGGRVVTVRSEDVPGGGVAAASTRFAV
jgi:hypothetical protein